MKLFPLSAPLIRSGDDFIACVVGSLAKHKPRAGDIVAITSKSIAVSENRLIKLSTISPSTESKRIGRKYRVSPELVELVRRDGVIIGGVRGVLLTIAQGIAVANSGIDLSNVPEGYAVRWPEHPALWAAKIHTAILKTFGVRAGIVITDSVCSPLRKGTTAVALAIAGFEGIRDERGKRDLYGRKMRLTTVNTADTLASAANHLMGERSERRPFILIRDAGITLSKRSAYILTRELRISKQRDMFQSLIS